MPSQRNRDRRVRNIRNGEVHIKGVDMQEKMVANSTCVWCGADQPGFSIICRRCKTCQYCGMFCGRQTDWCRFCGNRPLEDDVDTPTRRRVVAGRAKLRAQEPRKPKKRNVRRSGPMRRDRRFGGVL